MTYTTLMQQSTISSEPRSHDGLVPTGTDAAEWGQVASLYGEKVDNDVAAEFRDVL